MSFPLLMALSQWLFSTTPKPPAPPVPMTSTLNSGEDRAIVTQIIQPGQRGWVGFQATEWSAICPYCVVLLPDTPVRVIGRINTTLVIEPLPLSLPMSWSPLNVA